MNEHAVVLNEARASNHRKPVPVFSIYVNMLV